MPAKADIQSLQRLWIPAYAKMTRASSGVAAPLLPRGEGWGEGRPDPAGESPHPASFAGDLLPVGEGEDPSSGLLGHPRVSAWGQAVLPEGEGRALRAGGGG
jgi:hypothetical protein